MLITAHLVASNSSSAEAGTCLWVPAVRLCYPEARGGGAAYIRRAGQASDCFLLQTCCFRRAKSSESVKSMHRTAVEGSSCWNRNVEAEKLPLDFRDTLNGRGENRPRRSKPDALTCPGDNGGSGDATAVVHSQASVKHQLSVAAPPPSSIRWLPLHHTPSNCCL